MSVSCRAPALADFGHVVTCIDKDPAKIDALRRGEMPIYEPGLADLVAKNVREGRLSFTTDLAEAVRRPPTRCSSPSARPRGAATAMPTSPTSIRRRARSPARHGGYTVIVTKSTVPVGTGDEVERIIARGAARGRLRRRLQPGVPARGRGDRRLQAARPHRHRHRG